MERAICVDADLALTPARLSGTREFLLKPCVTEDDRADIRASLEGDESAYTRLVERYESQVFAQMWRFARDRVILDELVQDVFVEVFLNLRRFRGEAPFLHWLRRIATRTGYRHWRKEYRLRKQKELLTAGSVFVKREPVQAPAEAGEALFRMLEALTPKDRLALTLYYFEGCDTYEIADRTGWSVTLVRVRMHRACRRLRGLLTEAGFGRMGR
mgnify:CR=1 FL=1